jgi:hypothetical protein
VCRVIERAEAGETGRAERARNYDATPELIAARSRSPRVDLGEMVVPDRAVAHGYEGSPRNFRRLVAQQKAVVA